MKMSAHLMCIVSFVSHFRGNSRFVHGRCDIMLHVIIYIVQFVFVVCDKNNKSRNVLIFRGDITKCPLIKYRGNL